MFCVSELSAYVLNHPAEALRCLMWVGVPSYTHIARSNYLVFVACKVCKKNRTTLRQQDFLHINPPIHILAKHL